MFFLNHESEKGVRRVTPVGVLHPIRNPDKLQKTLDIEIQCQKALNNHSTPFIRTRTDAGMPRVLFFALRGETRSRREFPMEEWVYSSVVEHFVDIEGVTSSNLVTPTILRRHIGFNRRTQAPRKGERL